METGSVEPGAMDTTATPRQRQISCEDQITDRAARTCELYVTHFAELVRVARRLVDSRSAAEDIVQDAFATFATLATPPQLGRELSYLRSMVLNAARSTLRKRQVRERISIPAPPAASSPEDECLRLMEGDELVQRLSALPTRQLQVLALRHYHELSEAEIAERLQISKGSVKVHASRALASSRVSYAIETAA